MSWNTILFEKRGHTACITLNRPEVLNSISIEMMKELKRAYQLGLITEIVPADKLMERAWEIADTVNLNAPLAVRGTRMAIRKGLSLPIYEAELLAESYRVRCARTDDAAEGPMAFIEKRDPVWKAG